jgi:hypothetical protein
MTIPLSALGATLDTSTPSDPELRIKWSAINTVLNWDTVPTTGTADLDPWITSILGFCLPSLQLFPGRIHPIDDRSL